MFNEVAIKIKLHDNDDNYDAVNKLFRSKTFAC